MEYAIVGFLWILNLGICLWNCYAIGKSWVYTRQDGGIAHFVNWSAYLMTIAGLSWCFLIPEAILCYYMEWINKAAFMITLKMGYLIFGGTIVVAGIGVWLDSVATAIKERNFASIAVAGWNTFAQVSNTIDYVKNAPGFFEDIGSFFSSDDDGGQGVVILLVVLALIGGWVVAHAITSKLARSEALELRRSAATASR